MLGPKPTQHSATAPHHLAAATTEMMWSCALATARLTVASSARGLALCSRLLRAPFTPSGWRTSAAATHQATHAPVAAGGASESATTAGAITGANAAPAFASYRTSSGHASAQVIVPR